MNRGGGDEDSIHPLRLICLNYALKIGMPTVFSGIEEYKLFGNAPWLYLNPVCPHYKKEVIIDVSLGTNSKDNRIEKLKECPNESRRFFQKSFPSEYRFCFKHNSEWFEEHSHKTVESVFKTISFHKGVKSRELDWHKIDLDYSEQIKDAINIFKEKYPNSRAPYAVIERILGKHNYCVRLKDKVPISFSILDNFVTSTSHF